MGNTKELEVALVRAEKHLTKGGEADGLPVRQACVLGRQSGQEKKVQNRLNLGDEQFNAIVGESKKKPTHTKKKADVPSLELEIPEDATKEIEAAASVKNPDKCMPSSKPEWDNEVLQLADEFLKADRDAGRYGWRAAVLAFEMRKKFPKKTENGKPGWCDFCEAVLKRSRQAVADYLAAAEHCEAVGEDWKAKAVNAELPPLYLVVELSRRADGPERRALHDQLFSGKYESREFLKSLAALAEIEQAQKKPEPSNPPPGTGQANDQPEPANAASKGAAPAKPVTQKKVTGRVPLSETKTVAAALTTILPLKTRQITIDVWTDVTSLGQEVSAALVAAERDLEQHGVVIVIKPRKTTKKEE